MADAIQTTSAAQLLGGAKRHIQGIASDVDAIRLLGESFRANVSDSIIDPGIELERSIDSASTLTIPLEDADGQLRRSKLLESAFELELDDLWFSFVGARKEGDSLTLTLEAREVKRLRRMKGAVKVFRGKWTRAEFYAKLVKEARPEIPLFSPQLHKRRPIEDDASAKEDSVERDITRGHGIDDEAAGERANKGAGGLTVKGVAATAEQLRNGDAVLRVGESLGAGKGAMISSIVTGIAENTMLNSGEGFFQITDSTAAGLGFSRTDLAAAANHYFAKGFTGAGGAIAVERQHPSYDPAQISSAVEGNAAGSSDRDEWISEASKWVEFFSGGELTDTGGASSSGSIEVEVPYAFERKKNESTWACGNRLAEEVNFRNFESAGIIYFVAEPRLMQSRVRMRVDEDAPGITAINFDYDVGRRVHELTVNCYARAWSAPPGSVALVAGEGPADGRYLVSTIHSNLSKPDEPVEITLKRPTPPLPEPAPETRSKTVSIGSSAELSDVGGAEHERLQRMIAEVDRLAKLHLPYVFGGGHSTPAPANGPFDCSSFVSRILQVGGFGNPTMATGQLSSWGASGKGEFCTVYVHNGGAGGGHTIIKLLDRFAECGGGTNPSGGGPTWFEPSASYLTEFESLRHPPGL